MVTQAIAEVMNVGDHGSTFAGNPLVCHAAEAVVDIITAEGFLEDVTRKGQKLRAGLEQVLGSNPHVKQVRGLGLIVGVQLDVVRLLTACCTHSCSAVMFAKISITQHAYTRRVRLRPVAVKV